MEIDRKVLHCASQRALHCALHIGRALHVACTPQSPCAFALGC